MVYLALLVIWAAIVGRIVVKTDPYLHNRASQMLAILGTTLVFAGLVLLYCVLSC